MVAEFPTLKPGPEGYFRAGNALFGEENYRAAAVAYWRSYKMQRDIPNSPYINQALIGTGISALRAGNPAIARKAFDLVQDDSAFNEIAALWKLYAETTGARGLTPGADARRPCLRCGNASYDLTLAAGIIVSAAMRFCR